MPSYPPIRSSHETDKLETEWMELQSCANCWKHVWEKTRTDEARDQYCYYAGLAGDVYNKLHGRKP